MLKRREEDVNESMNWRSLNKLFMINWRSSVCSSDHPCHRRRKRGWGGRPAPPPPNNLRCTKQVEG